MLRPCLVHVEKSSHCQQILKKREKSVFLLTKGLGLYSQQLIFFVTYELPNKLECLSLASLSSLV